MVAEITGYGPYVPYRRIERSTIAKALGSSAGSGLRSVAGYDEDATSMGVEATRNALAAIHSRTPEPKWSPDVLLFATTKPPYQDKTNATAIAAALSLPNSVGAYDFVGAVRSGLGAIRMAATSTLSSLVVLSEVRTGLPGSSDEANGGDGAVAFALGNGPNLTETLSVTSISEEFLDRWRTPGSTTSKVWEERFGETVYLPLAQDAILRALKEAGLAATSIDHVIATGLHSRATRSLANWIKTTLGATMEHDLASEIGHTGTAHTGMLLADLLDRIDPDRIVLLIQLADGADAIVLRTTPQLLGFTASRCLQCNTRHLPPTRVCRTCHAVDQMRPEPAADSVGTIATYTIDRLAYSLAPPVVWAIINLDDGGRIASEVTDLDSDEIAIGQRVTLTFRRLYTATTGVHNYFWKAKLSRN